jgi:cytochrome P450 family 6
MVDYSFYFVTEIREIDVVAQVLVFFSAGFETSSSTLTFALMEMARSPLVQQKARENIEQVLERHDGQMSYQALQEMTYLDWILQGT